MDTTGSLHGKRVLVVEDEFLIADDLARQLAGAGAEVIGPVPSQRAALAALGSGPRPDLAILDIGLRDGHALAVADALRASAIPFVFASGYEPGIVPKRFEDVPFRTKPFAAPGLVTASGRLAGRGERDAALP